MSVCLSRYLHDTGATGCNLASQLQSKVSSAQNCPHNYLACASNCHFATRIAFVNLTPRNTPRHCHIAVHSEKVIVLRAAKAFRREKCIFAEHDIASKLPRAAAEKLYLECPPKVGEQPSRRHLLQEDAPLCPVTVQSVTYSQPKCPSSQKSRPCRKCETSMAAICWFPRAQMARAGPILGRRPFMNVLSRMSFHATHCTASTPSSSIEQQLPFAISRGFNLMYRICPDVSKCGLQIHSQSKEAHQAAQWRNHHGSKQDKRVRLHL